MAELTKEYFEEHLHKQLHSLEGNVVKVVKDSTEELARMVQVGFEDMQRRLDVREKVEKLEIDMVRVKSALNVA
jgi:hypothetical protein